MDERFPELTSFGTLLKFALTLEEMALEQCNTLSLRADCAPWKDALVDAAKRHRKRCKKIERYRKERLNEVVLQPISGMAREEYLPNMGLPEEATSALCSLGKLEDKLARFFDDSASQASNVLGGLDKVFRKLAAESRELKARLK